MLLETVFGYELITHEENDTYEASSDKTRVDWELTSGSFLIVGNGSVVFSPYAGKPPLGFE